MPNSTAACPDLDRRRVRQGFDRVAPGYEAAAELPRRVVAELLDRTHLLRARPACILDVGCGTGIGTRALRERYPRATVVGIDPACRMLVEARRRHGRLRRKGFAAGECERLPLANGAFDMALAALMLPWCNVEAGAAELRRVLRPGGVLLFASFGPDTLAELRAAWAAADDRDHVHPFLDMHEVGDALLGAGFVDPVVDINYLRLTYPSVPALLEEVRLMGGGLALAERRRGLTGRRRWHRFLTALAAGRDADGRQPLTFELVYGQAWVPAGRSCAKVPLVAFARR